MCHCKFIVCDFVLCHCHFDTHTHTLTRSGILHLSHFPFLCFKFVRVSHSSVSVHVVFIFSQEFCRHFESVTISRAAELDAKVSRCVCECVCVRVCVCV